MPILYSEAVNTSLSYYLIRDYIWWHVGILGCFLCYSISNADKAVLHALPDEIADEQHI